jgi:F0F1-type ATP synthase assembly protein I
MVNSSSKNKKAVTGEDKFAEIMYQRSLFLNMALNMSWQLAIVVIVPIVGGFELDKYLNTTPWLTVAGAVIAALGVIAILRQTVKSAAVRFASPKNGSSK